MKEQEIVDIRCQGGPETCLHIGSVPGADSLNPYIRLFYRTLETDGIALAQPPKLDARWLAAHANST